VSLRNRLALERSIMWAACRAIVQLLAVGLILDFVFGAERSLAWSWAWVVVMLLVAADTVQRRARRIPGLAAIAALALGSAAALSLLVLFGLSVFPLEPRALVPAAGLMLGNSMPAAVLVTRRVVDELDARRSEVEARLALGLTSSDASRPYVRTALRDALTPQIEQTKVVGLIALPGAMTGLILAGVEPLDAVRVQAAVMFLVLGSVAVTVTVIGLSIRRKLFTSDHRLVLPAVP
jgi:putative ABC transport system permease protein